MHWETTSKYIAIPRTTRVQRRATPEIFDGGARLANAHSEIKVIFA